MKVKTIKGELEVLEEKLIRIEHTLYWNLEIPLIKRARLINLEIDKHYNCRGKNKKDCLDEIKFEINKIFSFSIDELNKHFGVLDNSPQSKVIQGETSEHSKGALITGDTTQSKAHASRGISLSVDSQRESSRASNVVANEVACEKATEFNSHPADNTLGCGNVSDKYVNERGDIVCGKNWLCEECQKSDNSVITRMSNGKPVGLGLKSDVCEKEMK